MTALRHPTVITLIVTAIVAMACGTFWLVTENWKWGVAGQGALIAGAIVGILFLLSFPISEPNTNEEIRR